MDKRKSAPNNAYDGNARAAVRYNRLVLQNIKWLQSANFLLHFVEKPRCADSYTAFAPQRCKNDAKLLRSG